MLSSLPLNLLLAGLTFLCVTTEGAPFQRSRSLSKFFGLAEPTPFSILDLPRGGEEVVVDAEPEVLYLPGLLDVELKKSKQVSFSRGPGPIRPSLEVTQSLS
jgi:hypothetical protein